LLRQKTTNKRYERSADVAAKVRIRYYIFPFFFSPISGLFLISLQLYKGCDFIFSCWFVTFCQAICVHFKGRRTAFGALALLRSFRSAVPWDCRSRSERSDVETLYTCLTTQANPSQTKSALNRQHKNWTNLMLSRCTSRNGRRK